MGSRWSQLVSNRRRACSHVYQSGRVPKRACLLLCVCEIPFLSVPMTFICVGETNFICFGETNFIWVSKTIIINSLMPQLPSHPSRQVLNHCPLHETLTRTPSHASLRLSAPLLTPPHARPHAPSYTSSTSTQATSSARNAPSRARAAKYMTVVVQMTITNQGMVHSRHHLL